MRGNCSRIGHHTGNVCAPRLGCCCSWVCFCGVCLVGSGHLFLCRDNRAHIGFVRDLWPLAPWSHLHRLLTVRVRLRVWAYASAVKLLFFGWTVSQGSLRMCDDHTLGGKVSVWCIVSLIVWKRVNSTFSWWIWNQFGYFVLLVTYYWYIIYIY